MSACAVAIAKSMGFYRRFLVSFLLALSSLVTIVSIASAQTREIELFLDTASSQSFELLIQQAQNLAKTSIEQEFAANPGVTNVSILISGERNGQIAPILRSNVSRSQWQQDPRIHRWTRAFSSSGVLLGFYNPSVSSTSTPTPGFVSGPQRLRLEDDPGYRDD